MKRQPFIFEGLLFYVLFFVHFSNLQLKYFYDLNIDKYHMRTYTEQ